MTPTALSSQGFLLTVLSSVMCVMGAAIIYLDLLIKTVSPESSFDIKSSKSFLIMGFSVSCGSLLYTSLFKLLPKASTYFDGYNNGLIDDGEWRCPSSLYILGFFNVGVLVCLGLNKAIHYFASESIVHCSHGGDEENQTHDHDHSHGSSTVHGHSHTDSHSHSHSHDHDHDHDHSHKSPNSPSSDSLDLTSKHTEDFTLDPSTRAHHIDEETPLLSIKRRTFSFVDDADPNELCISHDITDKISNDIQNLEFYRDLKSHHKSLVAYVSTDNLNHQPTVHIDAVPTSSAATHAVLPEEIIHLANEDDLHLHFAHEKDHQHMINTPLSRIFSLGLQTCLALTLHKFPEGFITYATSTADPRAGVAIFLSLAIHNVMEGFTMVLPLYLALNSRIKAFAIVFVLGGFSQPLGALIAYFVLRGKELSDGGGDFVFGVIMAITCGFLLVVSLQLFGSAVNFGGSPNRVVMWCVLGIFIIQLSAVLTDMNSF